MKILNKTTLILTATLILGIIIGMLSGGLLQQRRIEKIQRMDTGSRFQKALFRIIKPDEKQRKAIETILEEQADKISRLEESYQNEVFTIIDSTRRIIKSILTQKQLHDFEKGINKSQNHYMERRLCYMKKTLNLNDEQYIKIKNIMLHTEDSNRPFFFEYNKDRHWYRQSRDSLMKRIEATLTPEQIKKFRQMYHKSRNHHKRYKGRNN